MLKYLFFILPAFSSAQNLCESAESFQVLRDSLAIKELKNQKEGYIGDSIKAVNVVKYKLDSGLTDSVLLSSIVFKHLRPHINWNTQDIDYTSYLFYENNLVGLYRDRRLRGIRNDTLHINRAYKRRGLLVLQDDFDCLFSIIDLPMGIYFGLKDNKYYQIIDSKDGLEVYPFNGLRLEWLRPYKLLYQK